MATELCRPNANGTYAEYSLYGDSSSYACVDEVTSDDDATYIYTQINSKRATFLFSHSVPSGSTINSVTVYAYAKRGGAAAPKIVLIIYDGSEQASGESTVGASYAEFSQTFTTNPSGGSWSYSDLASLEFGVRTPLSGFFPSPHRVTQCWIVIDYTLALTGPPQPYSLQVDYQVHPLNASEIPNFSALFLSDSASQWVKYGYVAVSLDSTFASPSLHVASSGWIEFSDSAFNNDRVEINWDSSGAGGGWESIGVLSSKYTSASPYYFKMQFKDTETGSTSNWSTASWFCGFNREWALPDYNFRHKLLFNTAHVQVDTSYTANFRIKTGNKKIVASNGVFNESIQTSRTQHYLQCGNREHVFYLSELSNVLVDDIVYGDEPHFGISVVSMSETEKGDPYLIREAGTGFDSHYYPGAISDGDDYIHLVFGCHDTTMKYLRSKYPNTTGSLDTGSGTLWINPANNQSTPAVVGAQAAYPVFIYDKIDDVIYLFYRKNMDTFVFQRSTNGGQSWSMVYYVINDHHPDVYRVYNSSLYYDKFRRRLHILSNHIHRINNYDYSMGIWYLYSQYDDTAGGGSDVGFSVWRNINGEILGYSTSSPA